MLKYTLYYNWIFDYPLFSTFVTKFIFNVNTNHVDIFWYLRNFCSFHNHILRDNEVNRVHRWNYDLMLWSEKPIITKAFQLIQGFGKTNWGNKMLYVVLGWIIISRYITIALTSKDFMLCGILLTVGLNMSFCLNVVYTH